ncbi:putative disease resistance RPP13-like protein 1 [Arachis duranensis]|uniref:Disease resistance RPP13-like protein 1 n=1 Tax=Arachis duranensis TaxID=130453 RepID=A0A6P4BZH1_ARADU|nr:putative disease resistance RPP13-like protein 1 [Arachis duranensis]
MENFGTRAWVCVAENPNPVNVTRTIIGAIDSPSCNVDHFDSLQTDLKEKLTGKRFLVVLDDVWHDRRDMWEDFLKPFHYENTGSKILLTTRSEKVASVFAANNLHYRLSLLSDEDWVTLEVYCAISVLKAIGRIYSIFPEDYEFDKDELILLWVAEDLLQPKENNALENVGCAYFDELVARSFFQPSSTNEKLFVMHDFMHDLATVFAGKFYFKVKEFGNQHVIDNKIRHLSYAATEDEDSIKLFQEANNRAVHMRNLLLASLLDSIGELIHLRYLNLFDTPIMTLPESICKLYNLQTLKLKNCAELEMLPRGMQGLVNLRHLDIRGASHLKEMPKEITKLKHLNFLSDYIVGKHEETGIRELGTLDNLHGSFCISKLENVKNSGEVLEAKMGNKKHINTLELNWLPDGDIDDVQTERDILGKLQPHQNLKELSIVMAAPHLEELHQYDCPKIDCFADEGLPPSLKNFNSLSATNSRVG